MSFLRRNTMTTDYNQKFGRNGVYHWPACLEVAEKFLGASVYANSTDECLDEYFFFEYLNFLDQELFYDFPEDEALKLIEAAAKSRQELFKEAKKWSLDDLVTSAIYFILSTDNISIRYMCWSSFLWVFLVFDEPLFDMLKMKGWNKEHRDQLQQSFRSTLGTEVCGGVTIKKVMWGSGTDNEKWFTCQGFASHIYPENVLRCLDLIGIDSGRAHLAVDEVFKLKSLAPLYDVLSNDIFPMTATLVESSDRSKGKKAETSFIANDDQKSSPDLPISIGNPIPLVLLFAKIFLTMVFPRLRSYCFQLNSMPQTQSTSCFAVISPNRP